MKVNQAFVLRHVGDIYLLIPARKNNITKHYFSLNTLGAWVWENADNFNDIGNMVDAMEKNFQLNQDERDQVDAFCHSLVSHGLIEV